MYCHIVYFVQCTVFSVQVSVQFVHKQRKENIFRMSDLMWGGVPFQIPSKTAMKYISRAVKVKVKKNI